MIQCKTPVTPWCNNLSLAEKRPVRIKSPITRIQYLREVPGFRSAGHIWQNSWLLGYLYSYISGIKFQLWGTMNTPPPSPPWSTQPLPIMAKRTYWVVSLELQFSLGARAHKTNVDTAMKQTSQGQANGGGWSVLDKVEKLCTNKKLDNMSGFINWVQSCV